MLPELRTRLPVVPKIARETPRNTQGAVWCLPRSRGRNRLLGNSPLVLLTTRGSRSVCVITEANVLKHVAIKYFDCNCVGEIRNANIAHDRDYFVGSDPRDLRPQIRRFRKLLDAAVR